MAGGRVSITAHQMESELDATMFFPVGEAESGIIRQGVAYWHEIRGGRRYPDRAQVTLKGLRRLAKHAAIVRVIDGGADYEFRFVGHEPTAAIGLNLQGKRMSEAGVASVMHANYRRQLYDRVVRTGTPWLFKSRTVKHMGVKLPVCSETAFLPLGAEDHAVDHLLGFTVFSSRGEI